MAKNKAETKPGEPGSVSEVTEDQTANQPSTAEATDQAGGSQPTTAGATNDAARHDPPDDPVDAAGAVEDSPKVRVVCSRPNASNCINGIAFATATIGDQSLHISALIDVAEAERLCAVPGYQLWPGDEKEHARTIEDALRESQRESILAGQSTAAEREALAERDELRASNRNLSARLAAANARLEVLEGENAGLRAELDRLKASGVRPE